MDAIWEHYLENVPEIRADDLRAVEQSSGIVLPSAVKALLMEHAGEIPMKGSIAISDQGHRTVFGPVLVSTQNTEFRSLTYTVTFAIDALNTWGNAVASRKLVPFASNTASGWFCVDLSPSGAARIVFIDTTYDPDEPGAISFVAKDVSDMLEKLE
jgi:cell wall assembly regulator SMI1